MANHRLYIIGNGFALAHGMPPRYADFKQWMIDNKEADETDYWLNILHDNGFLNDEQFESLKKDSDRILKILTSIVKTMKEKIKR